MYGDVLAAIHIQVENDIKVLIAPGRCDLDIKVELLLIALVSEIQAFQKNGSWRPAIGDTGCVQRSVPCKYIGVDAAAMTVLILGIRTRCVLH